MLDGMKDSAAPITIRTTAAPSGVVTYLISAPPEALPAVLPRDLDRAWHHARAAALADTSGPALLFRFLRGEDEAPTDLALTDNDARCWAEAVDAASGLQNVGGLSVCLRLLALIDLLGRESWAAKLIVINRDGAEISADLLREAATTPLNREARFDGAVIQARLSAKLLSR
jgi:hypothetical protein